MSSYTQYSTVLAISMGILLYSIVTIKQNIFLKLLYILFFISASSNIFIIQSKLGYGLCALSIIIVSILVILKHKKYWMIPVSLGLIIGGYFLAYNLSGTFHQRVNGFFNETTVAIEKQNYHTSTGTRVGFNKYGYELFKENSLFGVGTGDHISEFLSYILEEEKNKANYDCMKRNLDSGKSGSLHSEFLDNSLQFGIIGLLVFFNIFYQLVKYPNKDHYLKVVQILFVIILLAVSSVSVIFIYSKIGKIFTLLAAITLKLYYSKEKLQ
ncbi:MAG: O-antigen ligase family protein [Flavobacteriales bacterium]|nr:O-antigen ligase family protein [Flavobacteriales bacterium]